MLMWIRWGLKWIIHNQPSLNCFCEQSLSNLLIKTVYDITVLFTGPFMTHLAADDSPMGCSKSLRPLCLCIRFPGELDPLILPGMSSICPNEMKKHKSSSHF